MSLERISDLEQRCARLEARSRWGRRMCLILLMLVTLAGANIIKDTLDVREQLIIRDRGDTVRVDLGVERSRGLANGLVLFDKNGKRRIVLSVDDNGVASLGFYDQNGEQTGNYH